MLALLAVVAFAHEDAGEAGRETASATTATTAPTSAPATAVAYVGTTGCDDAQPFDVARDPARPWCSLTRAILAAPADVEIRVLPGSYAAPDVNRTPRPVGTLTIRSADPARRAQVRGANLNRVGGLVLSGLLFTKSVALINVHDVSLRDNGFASAPLYVRSSRDVTVEGNRIRHISGEQRAVLLQSDVGADPLVNTRIVLRGNVIDDVDHDALAVYNGYDRLLVEGNRISRVHQPDLFPFHADGMQFMGGDGLTLRGNVLSDVTHGILFKDGAPTTHLRVTGNLITRVGGAGLELYNAPGAVVDRNTIWGTQFGMRTGVPRVGISLVGNVLDRVEQLDRGSVARARDNVFGQPPGLGRPSYVGRPNFRDAARGDFVIDRRSPGARLPPGRPVPGAQLRVVR